MKISEEQLDIRKRRDRVGKYLKGYLNDFVFDKFSVEFMEKAGVLELMGQVEIPLLKADVDKKEINFGIRTQQIAENMAWIIGINPKFKYAEHYMAFLLKLYGIKIVEVLVEQAAEAAKKKEFDHACALFRASLCLNPNYMQGMFGYAVVCRDMYLQGGEEDYVGNLKAESIDFLELVTREYPKFAPAYYFLGYAYLNLGLYLKADITWKQFIAKSDNEVEKMEIRERLRQLEAPVEIENGCNDVLSGRFETGILKLQPYKTGSFETWWPLFYHLGIAYFALNESVEAVENFKMVLKLNPSNTEAMEQLALIYKEIGDTENMQKYVKKAELIKAQTANGGYDEN